MENCRLPNKTIKQLAETIETLVLKAFSLNKHDYKNMKMTEILMMTLTPQIRKIATKESITSSIDPRTQYKFSSKFVDNL